MLSKGANDSITKIFGNHIRELRRFAGLSQKDLAARLGIAESTYANWEQGRREPSIADICNLIEVFDITPNELFDWD